MKDLYHDRVEFHSWEKIIIPIIPTDGYFDLPDHSIDRIIGFFTFRSNETVEFLKKATRLLKSGGRGLIIDWVLRESDVRKSMILSIFPERRGMDPQVLMQQMVALGLQCQERTDKEGLGVIEFWKT